MQQAVQFKTILVKHYPVNVTSFVNAEMNNKLPILWIVFGDAQL